MAMCEPNMVMTIPCNSQVIAMYKPNMVMLHSQEWYSLALHSLESSYSLKWYIVRTKRPLTAIQFSTLVRFEGTNLDDNSYYNDGKVLCNNIKNSLISKCRA